MGRLGRSRQGVHFYLSRPADWSDTLAAITRPNPGMTSRIVLADAMEAPIHRISLQTIIFGK